MEGKYVTASEQAQGHHQTASLTVFRLRFLVPVGVHFIANSGSISRRIQAVKVTNPFIFPYAQQLWFSFIPLTCIACFTRTCENSTNPTLQVSQGRLNLYGGSYYLWVLGMELVSCRSSGVQRFEMATKYLENFATCGVNHSNTEMCDGEHQFPYFLPILMVKNQLRTNCTEESPFGKALYGTRMFFSAITTARSLDR